MQTINTASVPLYYIAYYKAKTDILQDISEEGYATIELCQAAIADHQKQDLEIETELLQKYEDDLKNFVLDLDNSDSEPTNPLTYKVSYDMKPELYYYSEKGHTKVEPHVIEGLSNLQTDPETIEIVNGILIGSIDPRTYSTVREWIDVCFYDPCSDELKINAINQVLEGYGIEAIRTSKWKNGYWCDILCNYVNMGDSYITTVIHHRKHGFMVSSIGDVIEKNKHVI
jgi:hypothetical protein